MTTASSARPIIRATDDGECRWFFGGGLHIWKATAEETNGAFVLFEDRLAFGKVTPLHTHPDSDESMIVLDGQILMHIAGEDHVVERGGLAMAPRGVPHAFKVTDPEGARVLCLHTPGCCEAFYWDASEPFSAETHADGRGPIDMERVRASAKKNGGIEILGPPPFA